MKDLISLLTLTALAAGCGGDGGLDFTTNPGFAKPTVKTRAWVQQPGGTWADQGDADLSCMGNPNTDMASTVAITLTGTVTDFQTQGAVAGATVGAFDGVDYQNVLVSNTSAQNGSVSLTLPAGRKRVGFKVATRGALDTYELHVYLDPGMANQSRAFRSVSQATAQALAGFIDVIRTPGLGALAGAFLDCQGRYVSGAIATVSSTSGTATHLQGAQTFYFAAARSNFPVQHDQQLTTNRDGLFLVLELPVAAQAYLQVWGYTPAQDPLKDSITLLAEIPSPVVADSIFTAGLGPVRP